jgi:hypothetical protein
MNGTEFSSGQHAADGAQELRYEVESLRSMLALTLLLLIIFTACVNLFLFHQANSLAGQVNEEQRRITFFQNVTSVQAIDFWNKINDYGSRHSDFAPILAKYKPFINVRTNAPAPKK